MGVNSFIVKGKRLETGAPEINVRVEGENDAEWQLDRLEEMYKKLYQNLFDWNLDVVVEKDGGIKEIRGADADVLKGIEGDDARGKFFLQHLKGQFSPKEMATSLVGQAFLKVPHKAVKAGETWKSSCALAQGGVQMSGTFDVSAKSVADGFDQFDAKGEFALDVARFRESTVEGYRAMRPSMEYDWAPRPDQKWPAEMTWWFNQASGRIETFVCQGKFILSGTCSGLNSSGKKEEEEKQYKWDLSFSLRWK
jgi:hypothetical protein